MVTLQAPDYLIEWSDGILGGFTDPTWALIAIAENRGIREPFKLWRRDDSGMQLFYRPITGEQLKADSDVKREAPPPWEQTLATGSESDTAAAQEFRLGGTA